ncbi:MAG: O-antigen ligase family protein [Patescibacteria group bacterium]
MDAILLVLSLSFGQLIKVPIETQGGLILLDLAVIILCVLGLFHTSFRLAKPPIWVKAALAFIMVATASLIFTPLTLTPFEYFISFSYIIRFSLYIFLGWLIFSNALPNIKENIHKVLLFSGFTIAVLGTLQLAFIPDLRFITRFYWDPHFFRTVSTFLDPNFTGAFLVLTLILWYQNRVVSKKWHLHIGIIIYIALLTTFSRGSYLAFLTAFLTLSLMNKSLKLGLITILLFLGLLLGFLSYERLVAEPKDIDRAQSAQSRLGTWQQGLELFQNHPILGIGFNSYRFALRQYNLGDKLFLQSRGSSTNDSSFLYITATTGIIGLSVYIFFLLTIVGKRKSYLTSGLMGLIAQSFFTNTLFYPPVLLWVILVAALEDKTFS